MRALRRRAKHLLLGVLTVSLVAASPACGGPSQGPAAPQDSLRDRAVFGTRLLESALPAGEPGCSAAVGVDGEVVWAAARGTADLATGRVLDTSTTFDIASVSKPFTATAVLLLAQDGTVDLQDPVSRWVPGLPAWAQDVTLDHLLHHTSGIPEYIRRFDLAGREYGDHITRRDILNAIAAMSSLTFPAGRRFAYSDSNYILLAEVVHAASGKPLAQFADARIFQPLDLDITIDPFGSSPDNTGTTSARGYLRESTDEEEPWRLGGSRWEMIGAGSVQATPSDLVRFGDNHRTGRIGGEDLLEAQLRDPVPLHDGTGDSYAAGLFLTSDGRLGHPGSWAGYVTSFEISTDRHTSIAVTCNRDAPGDPTGREIFEALRHEWVGDLPDTPT